MKDHKFARSRMWGLNGMHATRGMSNKGRWNVIGILVVGLLMLVVLLGPGYFSDLPAPSSGDDLIEIRAYETAFASSLAPVSGRNSSFGFKPKVSNWDVQRKAWLKENARVRAGRPKVLLVTGSDPVPCERPVDTHMFLKTAKNKIHYCRLHDIQMHYNLIEPGPEVTGSWSKLPVIRMLMLAHPEVEWFWWMDSNTVLIDMEFKLPLEKYEGYNFVIYGDEQRVHHFKDWNGLLAGNFLIRNCQWSLHLLDAWGSMGTTWSRAHVGELLSDALRGRPESLDADEQSSLVYLLTTEKQLWAPKLFLEKDIFFTSLWVEVTDKLEEMEQYPHGDPRLPVVTQFSGCSQCGGKSGDWPWEQCQLEMERAMDFADNQVYERYGYKLRKLGVPELVPIPGHVLEPVAASAEGPLGEFRGFPIYKLPGPRVTDWDEQREAYFKSNPEVKRTNEYGRPKTMLVTGSSSKECSHPVGSQLLLKGLKNKVDYARFHDVELFYGMVDFDLELTYWWTKIPTIRLLMLTRPDVEWFWWCDADAVITDMVFEVPYENYEDQNVMLYGDKELVYEKHDWIAINAGIYLIRNCQWSLDFFDVWASVGTTKNRAEGGRMATDLLVGREVDIDADDQSALIVMLITDTEKRWRPKVALERRFTISGYWKIIVHRFEEMKLKNHPGLGNMEWPWITHFAGCQPCGTAIGNFNLDECRTQMQRAFDFSDNQILELYGLEHSPLGTLDMQKIKVQTRRWSQKWQT